MPEYNLNMSHMFMSPRWLNSNYSGEREKWKDIQEKEQKGNLFKEENVGKRTITECCHPLSICIKGSCVLGDGSVVSESELGHAGSYDT